MLLSVIVCTHNRAALLPACLESLVAQDLPSDDYEVIVVENACDDDTSAAWEPFTRRHRNVHGMREPRAGKARALNAGASRARGTHVAFIDDDAQAPPQWLRRIATTFQEKSPPPAVIVGRIDHLYQQPPPIPNILPIVKGDTISVSIAAAAIIAKVARDDMMAALALEHPGYGWERNAGYPCRQHLDALEKYGVTPHHRRTYGPVAKILSNGLTESNLRPGLKKFA